MDQFDVVPLIRRSLHDDLVTRLRDMIIEGLLAPGERIHETKLGAALGVSRTPLREALKFVASEGLIDLVPGRGGIVRKLTPRDVLQMLEVLTALEILAARLACRDAADAQIAVVKELHLRMMAMFADRQRLEYYRLNQAIHSAIVQLSGNDYLAATHETIQSRLKRIRFIGNQEPANWAGAVLEHEQMMAALEARNAEALVEVTERHLRQTWIRVKGII